MAVLGSVKTFLQSQYTLWAAGLLGFLTLAIAAAWLGWTAALAGSPWLWVIVCLLVAVGIFVALWWGMPWLREQRFVRRMGSEYIAAGQESPEEFQAKFLKALHTLRDLPQLKGKADPLYALPWYLLIGESGSGKTTALQGADLFSRLLPLTNGGATQNCDWWVSNTAVLLDTAGRYAVPVDVARDRAEWYRLLRLLSHHRAQEPINGLVITIAIDQLVSQSEEKLRADASKLRERIEEAVRELGVDCPVYLLITKCDLLEGFGEFFAQLPERVRSEVIGYVDDPPPQPLTGGDQPLLRGTAALHRLTTGLQSIYDRLHLFRLSLLNSKGPEGSRPAIFCFPEEFKALQRPLSVFVETLGNEDVRYHTPLLRGIFFTSTQSQGARFSLLRRQLHLTEEALPVEGSSQPSFLHDLFHTILPRDRSLTRTTERARKRQWLMRLSGRVIGVSLLLLLAVFLVRAFVTDRRVVAAVNAASCPEGVQRVSSSPRVAEAESCRQVVQHLIDQNQQRPRWSALVFSRSFRLEEDLRQRYVRNFKATVLAPLDTTLERSFQSSPDPLPLMLLLAQRIQLSQHCASPAGCPASITDESQPDYALLLNPRRDQRPSPQDVAKLRATYTAYLLWQRVPQEELQQDLAEDRKRLQRWLSTKQFNPDQLLVWVNKRSPPITYETYWELPAPITAVAAPQIEAACTRQVWERDLAPFLQQIQDAVPEVAPQLRAFHQQYLSTCLTQWQRFLAGFPQGAERWKGPERRRTLALRLLTESSPYQRVIEEAAVNLAAWLPAEGEGATAPAWTGSLRSYLNSEQRQAYQDALKKLAAQLQLEPTALPETCFKLAQAAFAEGQPTPASTHPVLRAWWLATQPQGAPQKPEEDLWRPLLWQPVHYVWRFILDEAGLYLQKNWTENVSAPLKGLPPAEQVALLYGSGGKVSGFVEQFARPFLTGEDSRAGVVLGEGLPFSPRFFQMLSDVKRLKSVLDGGSGPQPVEVRATRRPELEGRASVVEEQTGLSVACAAKTYRVTGRPGEAGATVLWSPRSCGDVTLTISLSEREPGLAKETAPGAQRFQLTKRYTGQLGFLYFLQDFSRGSHRFQINDFTETDAEAEQALRGEVAAIQVYYRVDVPATLTPLVSALQEAILPGEIISLAAPLA